MNNTHKQWTMKVFRESVAATEYGYTIRVAARAFGVPVRLLPAAGSANAAIWGRSAVENVLLPWERVGCGACG